MENHQWINTRHTKRTDYRSFYNPSPQHHNTRSIDPTMPEPCQNDGPRQFHISYHVPARQPTYNIPRFVNKREIKTNLFIGCNIQR